MASIQNSGIGTTPFQQLLGHQPQLLERWNELEVFFASSRTFSAKSKEEVRRTLAVENGCQYCMAKGKPSDHIEDLKIQLAIKTALLSVKEIHLSDEHMTELRHFYTDAEISELLAFICFISASQRYGALLQLEPTCSLVDYEINKLSSAEIQKDSYCKMEVFIPESHLAELQNSLQDVDAGHIGNYDSCLSYSEVTGCWRPLSGSTPYIGNENAISSEKELKVEFICLRDNVDVTIEAIKRVHPYEVPVINVLPLYRTSY